MSISSASEFELSLISFAGSDSTSTWQGEGKKKQRMARDVGDDYSRKAINRQMIEG